MRQMYMQMDVRPVRTVEAILAFRDRCNGLLLSELGDALDGLGAKRSSTLVHRAPNWRAQQIEDVLLGAMN